MKSNKKTIGLLLLLCLLLIFSAIKIKDKNADKRTREVTITYVKSPLNIPSMVEKEKGIFAKRMGEIGVTVKYAEITSGAEQIQALENGDVQFLYAVGAASVIIGKANGADVEILNAYASAPKAYQMFSREEIRSAKDLRKKKVGGPKGTTLYELLAAYLLKDNVELSEIDYVNLAIPDAYAALEAGQIDVALLAGANAYRAEQSGFYKVTDGVNLTDGVTLAVSSSKFVKQNPDIVEAFQKAEKEILECLKNKEEALEIAARETGFTKKEAADMAELYDFHMELRKEDKESLKKTSRFLKKMNFITKEPKL